MLYEKLHLSSKQMITKIPDQSIEISRETQKKYVPYYYYYYE
jgi:hypothetical protein